MQISAESTFIYYLLLANIFSTEYLRRGTRESASKQTNPRNRRAARGPNTIMRDRFQRRVRSGKRWDGPFRPQPDLGNASLSAIYCIYNNKFLCTCCEKTMIIIIVSWYSYHSSLRTSLHLARYSLLVQCVIHTINRRRAWFCIVIHVILLHVRRVQGHVLVVVIRYWQRTTFIIGSYDTITSIIIVAVYILSGMFGTLIISYLSKYVRVRRYLLLYVWCMHRTHVAIFIIP